MTDHLVGVNGIVQIDPNEVLGIVRDEGVVTGASVLLWPGRWRIALRAGGGGGGASTITADDTPAAPAEGSSASYLVTSAVSWPAGLVWSTDPDGGVAPTITGTALVSMFTVGGTTRAVMGATFPAPVVPDTTAPVAGTLAPSGITATGFTLTVSGAADAGGLHATPYAFSTDNGATWSAWQAGTTYNATGLAAETTYTCQHKVRDAALNEVTGTAITTTTGTAGGTYAAWERQVGEAAVRDDSIHLPVAGTPGRLLVACISVDKSSGAVSVSSGWSLIAAAGTGGQSPTAMAWRIATGLDDITASTATLRSMMLAVHEYSGFSGVPNVTYAATDSGETSVTSITCDAGAAGGGGVAVAIAGLDTVNNAEATTVTSDYTTRQRTRNDAGGHLLAVADKMVQQGDPSAVTFGFGNSDQASAIVAIFTEG